jgi:CHASE1-domain containing sensor protein
MSEPTRSAAMRRAWETGAASLTGVVKLATGSDNPPLGMLMYLPVARRGLFLADGTGRRAAPAGFVYASFRLNTLMQAVLSDYKRDFALELREGAAAAPEAPLMFKSGGSPRRRRSAGPRISSCTAALGTCGWRRCLVSRPASRFGNRAPCWSPAVRSAWS